MKHLNTQPNGMPEVTKDRFVNWSCKHIQIVLGHEVSIQCILVIAINQY